MPANMLPKSTEALKSMNITTAKFAKWCVRVLGPKVVDYSFTARGEMPVGGDQGECVARRAPV